MYELISRVLEIVRRITVRYATRPASADEISSAAFREFEWLFGKRGIFGAGLAIKGVTLEGNAIKIEYDDNIGPRSYALMDMPISDGSDKRELVILIG